MPSGEIDRDRWDRAWQKGRSNNIIVFDKPIPLVTDSSLKELRVINFKDDASLNILEVGRRKYPGSEFARPRKKKPSTMAELAKEVQFVVLHADQTRNARDTMRDLMGRSVSSHFCINWNGIIYQYADIALKTSHAGKDYNDQTIGIDLNHMLVNELNSKKRERSKKFSELRREYSQGVREIYEEMNLPKARLAEELNQFDWELPRSAVIQGGKKKTWGYTPRQYESLILLLKFLIRKLKLKKAFPMLPNGKVVPEMLEGDKTQHLRGFVAHWHLDPSRWDPGPAFEWQRVLSALRNEVNWFPVTWGDKRLNLQNKDLKQASAAAYELYRNTETRDAGGTFPMGPNQTWHGGVHLFPPEPPDGKRLLHPVRAMCDGVVVAAHFEPGRRQLGHNNFVLLRHDVKVPKKGGKLDKDLLPETTSLQNYSLYMHLEPMDVTKEGADELAAKHKNLRWLKRLYEWEAKDKTAVGEALEEFQKELDQKRLELQQKLERGEAIDPDAEDMLLEVEEEAARDNEKRTYVPADVLTLGAGSSGLRKPGNVTVFGFDLPVEAGEILGFVGKLPHRNGEELVDGVHVEIFSSEATFQKLDMDRNGQHFLEPQRARGNSLVVRTEDILMFFRDAQKRKQYRHLHLWPDTRISPHEISDFFAQTPREDGPDVVEAHRWQLRKAISYHVSEWSDRVDWIASLTDGQPWDEVVKSGRFNKLALKDKGLFSDEVRKFLPWIWLTEEVADRIELKGDQAWTGSVYHYHPIGFLIWRTYFAEQRTPVLRTRMSLRKLRKAQWEARVIGELVEAGKQAHEKSPNAYSIWERRLPRKLARPPFGLKEKLRRKNEALQERYVKLRARIIDGVFGRLEEELASDSHGLVENEVPMFSNPGEVLKDLFQLPRHNEWKIPGLNTDDG